VRVRLTNRELRHGVLAALQLHPAGESRNSSGRLPAVPPDDVGEAASARRPDGQNSRFGLRWQSTAATPLLPGQARPQGGVALSLPATVQKRLIANLTNHLGMYRAFTRSGQVGGQFRYFRGGNLSHPASGIRFLARTVRFRVTLLPPC
jgi:hypothetical protein